MSLIVSADELEKFHRAVELLEKLGGLFKAAVISAFAVCTFVVGLAVWAHSTDAQAQQTREDLHSLVMERSETVKEWTVWRGKKDDIDSRLTAIVESQQRLLDRLDRRGTP